MRMPKRITPRNSTQPLPKRGVRSRDVRRSKIVSLSINAVSNCNGVNLVKRFVLFSVSPLKQAGGPSVLKQIRFEQAPIDATHFLAGEFVFLDDLVSDSGAEQSPTGLRPISER